MSEIERKAFKDCLKGLMKAGYTEEASIAVFCQGIMDIGKAIAKDNHGEFVATPPPDENGEEWELVVRKKA